jgi:hypothetical protein
MLGLVKINNIMPYYSKGQCVYKKNTGKKVGCTEGPVKKYIAALHANVEESLDTNKAGSNLQFKNVRFPSKSTAVVTYHYMSKKDSFDVVLTYKIGRSLEEVDYAYTVIRDNNDLHGSVVKFQDPQSSEFAEFVQAKRIPLTSEDIEMAGQDGYEKIESSFSDVPKLDEPYEEKLAFFDLFKKVISE